MDLQQINKYNKYGVIAWFKAIYKALLHRSRCIEPLLIVTTKIIPLNHVNKQLIIPLCCNRLSFFRWLEPYLTPNLQQFRLLTVTTRGFKQKDSKCYLIKKRKANQSIYHSSLFVIPHFHFDNFSFTLYARRLKYWTYILKHEIVH